ncbi:MAG: hypothetical protein AB7F79_07490 [Steroidobacteraceae bacterium]
MRSLTIESMSEAAARQLMMPYLERILELTNKMAQLALQEEWYELLDCMDERAQLMQQLSLMATDRDDKVVAALSKSVCESERAMNKIMAHAIISAREPGAEQRLRG